MPRKNPNPVVLWSPGEPEDDLYGFVTKKERDAFQRGNKGPFRRYMRDLRKHPITIEEAAMKAYLSGNLQAFIEGQNNAKR